MVPVGVQVFIFETESAASAGRLPQVVPGKAVKRNRRENSLSAVFVNSFGAIIPLLYRKLPERDTLRNNRNFISRRKSLNSKRMAEFESFSVVVFRAEPSTNFLPQWSRLGGSSCAV